MKKYLISIILLFLFSATALSYTHVFNNINLNNTSVSAANITTISADMLQDFNTGSDQDTLTTTILSNSQRGNLAGTWAITTGTGLTTLRVEAQEKTFNTPFLVNGVTYTSSSKSISVNENTGQIDYARFEFTDRPSVLSVGMFINFGLDGSGFSTVDQFVIAATTGDFLAISQRDNPAPSGRYILAHTQVAGGGDQIPVTNGKWYWVTLKYDVPNLLGTIKLYDPADNYSLVGTSSHALRDTTTVRYLFLGRGDNHGNSYDTRTYYSGFVIDTTGTYPLGP